MPVSGGVSLRGLPVTRAAIAYATERHAYQRRSVDGAPFIVHPIEVACLLRQAGVPDHVVAAGVLHDVVEKTGADAEELRTHFGSVITGLVLAVSEDPRIRSYTRRKAALRDQVVRAGDEALMVYAADKLSKVREMNLESSRTPAQPGAVPQATDDKLEHYRQSLRVLEDRLPASLLVRELRAELEQAPPSTGATLEASVGCRLQAGG